MKKDNFLEKKVMEKIFFWETKKTVVEIILKILILGFLLFAFWLFFDILLSILNEQKTFDLLALFKEDPEVIRRYFFDNLKIFFLEIPKVILALCLLLIGLLFLFIWHFKRKYYIIKNKVISLIKYWFKKI